MTPKKKLKDIAAGFEGSDAVVTFGKPDAELLLTACGQKKEFEAAAKTLSLTPASCTGKELNKLVALLPGD
jgi:hypothetical protein